MIPQDSGSENSLGTKSCMTHRKPQLKQYSGQFSKKPELCAFGRIPRSLPGSQDVVFCLIRARPGKDLMGSTSLSGIMTVPFRATLNLIGLPRKLPVKVKVLPSGCPVFLLKEAAAARNQENLRNPARATLMLLWGGLCILAIAPPLLSAHPVLAACIYLFFAPVCHQDPGRSFHLAGHALAVCHRCSGIYLGLFLGSLFPFSGHIELLSGARRRILVLAACSPLILDFALPYLGIWENTPWSRLSTGLIFGSVLAGLLTCGAEEIFAGRSWKLQRFQASPTKEGTS
jgi:uncharacterized membrane protein